MWKILAKTSKIMERIPKHSLGLLTILLFVIGFACVDCVTVTGDDKTGILGNNPVTMMCDFTVANGEVAQSLTIEKETSGTYRPLAKFFISTNISSYVDTTIEDRTTLILTQDSAAIRYDSLLCGDRGTFRCDLEYILGSVQNVQDSMNLVMEVTPLDPQISVGFNPDDKISYVEYEQLVMKCNGDVGNPAGNFLWFGYIDDQPYKTYTTEVDPGQVSQVVTGPRFCSYQRESTLTLNMTREDNNLVIRCVVNQTTNGAPPTPADSCQGAPCRQTRKTIVQYPVRQQDIAVSSNPSRNEYIVGSDVTLKCTVEGNPAPYFRWEKDGDANSTQENRDTWILTNLQLGQSGVYTCFANNSINGFMYNVSKSININVVETTTIPSTTPTTQATTQSTDGNGGITEPVKTGGGPDQTTIIIIVVVVICVILIIVIAVAVIMIRKRKANSKAVEEPPEKPFNKNNLHMYSAKPDLVNDEKKQNYNYKSDDQLTYADLKFDDKPRSRRPVALADNMTDYADITIPQV